MGIACLWNVRSQSAVAHEVIFFDKTEAVLSSKFHSVTYVDKKGQAGASMGYFLGKPLAIKSQDIRF